MTRSIHTTILTIALAVLAFADTVNAQAPKKAPDYIVSSIEVNAFNEAEGSLSDALDKDKPPTFFNALSTSLFVWAVVAGEAGSFEPGRMINVTVLEGKKVKTTRRVQIGLIGEKGVYFVPVYVYGSLCSNVTITAKITGQRKPSSQTVKIPFMCGE